MCTSTSRPIAAWSPYFIRQGLDAYSDPFRHCGQQKTWDMQLHIGFLLGLNWEYAAMLTEEERHRATGVLLDRTQDAKSQHRKKNILTDKEKSLKAKIALLRDQQALIQRELDVARKHLQDVRGRYNELAAKYDTLSAALAKLSALVDSAECPLCGRRSRTVEEAREMIREHISAVSANVKGLADELEEANKKVLAAEGEMEVTGKQ